MGDSNTAPHPLTEKLFKMSAAKKRAVHRCLAEVALKRWKKFTESGGPMACIETVTGTQQEVDAD